MEGRKSRTVNAAQSVIVLVTKWFVKIRGVQRRNILRLVAERVALKSFSQGIALKQKRLFSDWKTGVFRFVIRYEIHLNLYSNLGTGMRSATRRRRLGRAMM